MTCACCVRSVEQMLSAVQGLAHAEVHLGGGRAVVEGTALAETLVDAIKGPKLRRAARILKFNWRRVR